jgi:glycosyltransferase involved in cell wall biosynthesis
LNRARSIHEPHGRQVRRRILLDFSLIEQGGSATYAQAFLEELALRNDLDDVAVLVADSPVISSEVVDVLRSRGAYVRMTNATSGWSSGIRRLLEVPMVAARLRAAVVFFPRETAPPFIGRPMVVLVRNAKVWDRSHLRSSARWIRWTSRRLLAGWAVRRARTSLLVSASMAPRLGKCPADYKVVHHGCSLETRRVESTSELELGDPIRVVTLGMLNPDKGFEVIIDALAIARLRGTDATLEMWGSGPAAYEAQLRRHALSTIGVDPLKGPFDPGDRGGILRNADAVAVGSSLESFNHVLVEGMRSGVLVWAPRSPLLEEVCGEVAAAYDEGSAESAACALVEVRKVSVEKRRGGIEKSLSYQWSTTVEETLQAVRSAQRCRPVKPPGSGDRRPVT